MTRELASEQKVWAREMVTAFRYRDWVFGVEFTPFGLVLHGIAPALDVDGVTEDAAVRISREIRTDSITYGGSRGTPRPVFLQFLMENIWHLITDEEDHERMEAMRVGGIPVYDPHPGGGPGVSYPELGNPNLTGMDAALAGQPLADPVVVENYTEIPYLSPLPIPWPLFKDGAFDGAIWGKVRQASS